MFAALVVTAAYSPLVNACPYCLGKETTLPPSLKLVGVFLLVPFVVAGAVAAVARRLR
ncbi:MAG TPA: hypothetical protein VGL59_06670 [Polyangia bacterium]|jgi:hypothetical protein